MVATDAERQQELIASRYRVERILGQGGMGAVFAVVDQTTGRRVALKRLVHGDNPVALKLFEQEYRTLASLRHPGVVEAYEFGVVDDSAYYTMEILEGGDLSNSVPMAWRDACRCLRDAASILGVLHARRLVHRDVSPRNVWRTRTGQIKLLDFGSLAPFGEAREVVGTPPFIAPEALQTYEIDQRTDLYSLGALGYWLITGAAAFRARSVAELPAQWKRAPLPPSEVVQLLDAALPEVPAAVDEVLLNLLRLDPSERPTSTADLIDRLNEIAGLAPEAREAIMQGYLESKAFVGRLGERRAFESSLVYADAGMPFSTWIEGPEGIGRSRLLQELAVTARIGAAAVACTGAEASARPYGAGVALGLCLLEVQPKAARDAAAPYVEALAELSDELGRALGYNGQPAAQASPSNARARKQAALSGWLLTLSRNHTLALLVDDVHELDEESRAVLVTLLRAGTNKRLCLVLSARTQLASEPSPALTALRASSTIRQLDALSESETTELLRSSFGEVPYLQRLSARLHKLAAGNPEHCLLLVRQLVAAGTICYADGTWRLPQELTEATLPTTLTSSLLANLELLEPPLRSLARKLSVPDHAELTLESVVAASGLATAEASQQILALVTHGVLQRASFGYRFSRAVQRQTLYDELVSEERVRVHRALALHVEGIVRGNSLFKLRAALHWLRAAQIERAEPLLFEVGMVYMRSTVADSLRQAAPMFADAVALLDVAGRDDQVRWLPLAILTYAGYFVDRRYAVQYGPRATAVLSAALQMKTRARLAPWIGAKPALIAAIATAAIKLRRKRYVPKVQDLIYCLVSATTAAAGCATVSMDAPAVRRFIATLQPLAQLRSAGIVRFLLQFNEALALIVEGHTAEAQELLRGMFQRLADPSYLPEMPLETRAHYHAHTLALHGLYDAWACKPESLEFADKAEAFGPFHAIWADQVRGLYWSFVGSTERAMDFERRMELHAIQLGSAWQVEVWTTFMRLMSLTHDAIATKRAAQELEHFAETLPAYLVYARWMRASYAVLRGQYRAALELYLGDAEPTELLGWSVARAWFAEAMNGLAQHDRARKLCLDTLAFLSEANRKIVYISVRLEVELAMAEAGLGRVDVARAQLASLLKRHSPHTGPLVQGYLHMAQARVALRAKDYDDCWGQLERAGQFFAPLGIASLNEQLGALRLVCRSHSPEYKLGAQLGSAMPENDGHVLTRLQLILNESTYSEDSDRGIRALRMALDLATADRGFVLNATGQLVARIGDAPTQALEWARDALSVANDEDDGGDTEMFSQDEAETLQAKTELSCEGVYFHRELLWSNTAAEIAPRGILILGAEGEAPRALPVEVLRLIASGLPALKRDDSATSEAS